MRLEAILLWISYYFDILFLLLLYSELINNDYNRVVIQNIK
jgi:hypothetical protein